jgi:hypothetical protein
MATSSPARYPTDLWMRAFRQGPSTRRARRDILKNALNSSQAAASLLTEETDTMLKLSPDG